jgi:hypothetical protein
MTDEQSLSDSSDRFAVSDVVLGFARSLDIKDWKACRGCFLDEIETDYSDLRGEPPSRVQADDFVAKRRTALEPQRPLTLPSPPPGARDPESLSLTEGEGRVRVVAAAAQPRARRKSKSQPASACST